jgi:acyl carrier protein
VEERYTAVLRRHLRYLADGAPLPAGASLRDLGLDSMAAVGLLLDLEDAFGMELPDASLTAGTFATAGTLWAAVRLLVPRDQPTGTATSSMRNDVV